MYGQHQDIIFLIQSQKYDYAINKLKDRIADNIDDDYLFYLLSLCYCELDNFNQARFYIKKGLELNPDSIEILNLYAEVEIETGNFYKGSTILDESIKIDPEQEKVFLLRSRLHLYKNELEEASEEAKLTLLVNPNNTEAANITALILIINKNYSKANEIVSKTLTQDPLDSFSLINLGLIKYFNNEIQESKKIFQQTLVNNPENELIRNYLKLVIASKNIVSRKVFKLAFLLSKNSKDTLVILILIVRLIFAIIIFWGLAMVNNPPGFDIKLVVLLLWMQNILFIPFVIIPQLSSFTLYFDPIGKYLTNTTELVAAIITLICIVIAISLFFIYFNSITNMEHLLVLASYFVYLSGILGQVLQAANTLKKLYIVKIVVIAILMTTYAIFIDFRLPIVILMIISIWIYPILVRGYKNEY